MVLVLNLWDSQNVGGSGSKMNNELIICVYIQIKLLGDSISRHTIHPELSAPTAPLQNLYLPHLLLLAKIKLRIGHAMARQATIAEDAKPKK